MTRKVRYTRVIDAARSFVNVASDVVRQEDFVDLRRMRLELAFIPAQKFSGWHY
jgi:hypothetical protein